MNTLQRVAYRREGGAGAFHAGRCGGFSQIKAQQSTDPECHPNIGCQELRGNPRLYRIMCDIACGHRQDDMGARWDLSEGARPCMQRCASMQRLQPLSLRVQSANIWGIYGFHTRNRNSGFGNILCFGVLGPLGYEFSNPKRSMYPYGTYSWTLNALLYQDFGTLCMDYNGTWTLWECSSNLSAAFATWILESLRKACDGNRSSLGAKKGNGSKLYMHPLGVAVSTFHVPDRACQGPSKEPRPAQDRRRSSKTDTQSRVSGFFEVESYRWSVLDTGMEAPFRARKR